MLPNRAFQAATFLLFVLTFSLSLVGQAAFQKADRKDLGQRVVVYRIAPNTWVVESLAEFGSFGTVSSNAVVVEGTKRSILIDTPADDAQTKVVLDWAANTLRKPVEKLIVTHAHRDRIGGIHETNSRQIAAYAIPRTRVLARERGYEVPNNQLQLTDTVRIDGATVETFFPGHGHTEDNIVVWLPDAQILHGGCFVKDAAATNLGNLEEINPATWQHAVMKVQQKYPNPKLTIPGHGEPGGNELLVHTGKLAHDFLSQK